ncbi:MAG: hypothetical protein KAV87_01720 [Desulfobacteraceae bacterium]|nr:hypothetical protein [Desulfobacteraceae bacterium]
MEVLRWKARIAVLWLFMAVAMSVHSIMGFMEPGMIEEMMSGEIEGVKLGTGMLVFMALFWLVPLWLAFVSMTLKGSANRWVNFILGIIFTILNIWHFIGHLASPVQILIIGSTVVVTALIVWYAWRWPKQEA